MFRTAACQMGERRTEGHRKEEVQAAECRTGEDRMAFRMEAGGGRWTRPHASRSLQRPWQLAAHQRAGRQRVAGQKAHQREECRMAVGQRRLQMEEVPREFRWEEAGGCSRLPS